MPLPNLILAGGQRCGSTSLHHLLASHPEIFFPERPQEIHYFDLDENYRRGREWFEALFALWRGQRYLAQTSPLYLFEEAVPRRCHELLPEARVVVILRDPTARAWSHYWHEVRYGWEDRPFAEALDLEAERLTQGAAARRHYSYTARGRYARQLAGWLELYPRERILVLIHEELKADPGAVAERCARFLEIELEDFHIAGKTHFNAARLPRFAAVQRWVRDLREHFPRLGYAVDRLNLRKAAYPKLAPELKRRLAATFSGEAAELIELTGVDARAWWPEAPEIGAPGPETQETETPGAAAREAEA